MTSNNVSSPQREECPGTKEKASNIFQQLLFFFGIPGKNRNSTHVKCRRRGHQSHEDKRTHLYEVEPKFTSMCAFRPLQKFKSRASDRNLNQTCQGKIVRPNFLDNCMFSDSGTICVCEIDCSAPFVAVRVACRRGSYF